MVKFLAVMSLVLMGSIFFVFAGRNTHQTPAQASYQCSADSSKEIRPPWCVACPYDWVFYNRKCYYFSDAVGTWDFSKRFCASHGASLTAIDTLWEMEFLMRAKGPRDHWIGLRRENVQQPWKWTNGSIFDSWFEISANGPCAFLNDYIPSSTQCEGEMYWICAKSLI